MSRGLATAMSFGADTSKKIRAVTDLPRIFGRAYALLSEVATPGRTIPHRGVRGRIQYVESFMTVAVFVRRLGCMAAATLVVCPATSYADESGISFWVAGL